MARSRRHRRCPTADGLFAVDHVVGGVDDVGMYLSRSSTPGLSSGSQWLMTRTRIIDFEEGRKRSTAERAYTVNDHEPAGVGVE